MIILTTLVVIIAEVKNNLFITITIKTNISLVIQAELKDLLTL